MKFNLKSFQPSLLDVALVILIASWTPCNLLTLTRSDGIVGANGHLIKEIEQKGAGLSHRVGFEKNRAGYEKLEEYLYKHVKNNESVSKNMEEVGKLLESELAKPDALQDKQLISALEQFESLNRLNRREHCCNREGYDILHNLNMATYNRVHKAQSKLGVHRRIELILAEYNNKHANMCKSVYPHKFQNVYGTLDMRLLDQIDTTMEKLIDERVLNERMSLLSSLKKRSPYMQKVRIHANFMQTNDQFKSQRDAKAVLDSINKLAARDQSRNVTNLNNYTNLKSDEQLNEAELQIRELIQRYLMEPCKYYNDNVGPDIFIPAQNDAVVLEKASRFKPDISEEHNSFTYGWVRFGYCSMLHRDQYILTKKVVALALNK